MSWWVLIIYFKEKDSTTTITKGKCDDQLTSRRIYVDPNKIPTENLLPHVAMDNYPPLSLGLMKEPKP